jgi:hypothetical protein
MNMADILERKRGPDEMCLIPLTPAETHNVLQCTVYATSTGCCHPLAPKLRVLSHPAQYQGMKRAFAFRTQTTNQCAALQGGDESKTERSLQSQLGPMLEEGMSRQVE